MGNSYEEVGQVAYGVNFHAAVWHGTAQSIEDLHSCLPSYFVQSYATGVDSNGNIVGAAVDREGRTSPILWTPVG